jgi:hypothetical protein
MVNFGAYKARFSSMLELTHPRHLFETEEDITRYMKDGSNPGAVSACVRGGSSEIIPAPCRMAGIAPMNIPIVFFMLITPASAQAMTLSLHLINQTYNSACNYFNRSGDSLTMEDIGKSYVAATSAALTMAFGLGKVMAKGPPALRGIPWLIPTVASASAGCSNLVFMRLNEITEGTAVMDTDGQVRGKSIIAGKDAVFKTAIGRCCMVPCAVLLLPSIAMKIVTPMAVVKANPRLRTFVEIGCVYASLAVALPAAIAIYPSTTTFLADELEPEFHDLKDKNGEKVVSFVANKGM